jgi:hypothetical protein
MKLKNNLAQYRADKLEAMLHQTIKFAPNDKSGKQTRLLFCAAVATACEFCPKYEECKYGAKPHNDNSNLYGVDGLHEQLVANCNPRTKIGNSILTNRLSAFLTATCINSDQRTCPEIISGIISSIPANAPPQKTTLIRLIASYSADHLANLLKWNNRFHYATFLASSTS